MPNTKVRVVGSGFTTINFYGKAIAWLEEFRDEGQAPFGGPNGRGWEQIIPIGRKVPIEIATGRVLGAGTATLAIKELWNEPVWATLHDTFRGMDTIIDVWEKIATLPAPSGAIAGSSPLTMQKIITPPGGGARYGRVYHGCVIVDIDDGETVRIGDLSINKNISVVYTHTTRL